MLTAVAAVTEPVMTANAGGRPGGTCGTVTLPARLRGRIGGKRYQRPPPEGAALVSVTVPCDRTPPGHAARAQCQSAEAGRRGTGVTQACSCDSRLHRPRLVSRCRPRHRNGRDGEARTRRSGRQPTRSPVRWHRGVAASECYQPLRRRCRGTQVAFRSRKPDRLRSTDHRPRGQTRRRGSSLGREASPSRKRTEHAGEFCAQHAPHKRLAGQSTITACDRLTIDPRRKVRR